MANLQQPELWSLADFLRVAVLALRESPNQKYNNSITFEKSLNTPVEDISGRVDQIEVTLDKDHTMRCGPAHAYVNGKDGLSSVYNLYAKHLKQIPVLSSNHMTFFKNASYMETANAHLLIAEEIRNAGGANLTSLLKKTWQRQGSVDISSKWSPSAEPTGKADILCFPALFVHYQDIYAKSPAETWKRVAEDLFPWNPDYALNVAATAWKRFENLTASDRKLELYKLATAALESGRFNTETKQPLEKLADDYSALQKIAETQKSSSSVSSSPFISSSEFTKEGLEENIQLLQDTATKGVDFLKAINLAKTPDARKAALREYMKAKIEVENIKKYAEELRNFISAVQMGGSGNPSLLAAVGTTLINASSEVAGTVSSTLGGLWGSKK